jgi:hypothetical protein
MSDVASVCSAPIVGEARARGLDPAELAAGLDLRLADLENPRRRIPWRSFVVFAERAANMLGPETLEELAAAATLDTVPRPIRRVLPRLRDSRPLFGFAARWWGPWIFRGTRGRCEVLPDGRIREVVRILPGYAPCPEFLTSIRGTLRAMPRLLNQPDALVTFEQDGREGEYIITPPFRRTRSGKALPPRRDTLGQLGGILARAGDGDSDALHRDIVRLVQQQHGIAGVRLAEYDETDHVREFVAGTTMGAPSEAFPLRIADRPIGQLEFWRAGEDVMAPLRELVPWIAFAVEYGRSKALVTRLVASLMDHVRDWERVERRLEQIATRRVEDPSSSAEPAEWPPGERETIDLAEFVYSMASCLRELTGDAVQLELCCGEGLLPIFSDRNQLESLIEYAVETLCDIGSEEIRIEARAVAEGGQAAAEPTTAEILVWGRGGELAPGSRSRLQTALELLYTGLLVSDLDIEGEQGRAVGVRISLPLRTHPARGRLH